MVHRWHMKLILLYITLVTGMHTPGIRQKNSAGFTFRSIIETLIPGISPLLDSDMSKCEALKSMFGITYEQMLQRNATSFLDQVNLDYISETETLKYNASTAIKLNKIAKNAENIVVFVHGFMESSDGMMVQALVPEFLKQKGIMLLALDGKKVITLEYFRSSTYARFMGELLGGVLINLIEEGQDPSKIHLIGHSLGSHIVGRAGKHVRETSGKIIGRITGLDPAGPCFSTVSTDDRLDQSDAAYVDVIHSNAGRLGIVEPIGHKDFYPNGGVSQPGCYFFLCDHSRAWELLAESINSPKAFPARKCENWTSFKEGRCRKKEIAHLGYHSQDGSSGVYFLTTRSSPPYSLGAFVEIIETATAKLKQFLLGGRKAGKKGAGRKFGTKKVYDLE